MHDIRAIRDDAKAFIAGLNRRGLDGAAVAKDVLAKDKALRDLLVRLQTEQARRNEASKLIGQAKQKKDEAQAQALLDELAGLKQSIQAGEAEQRALEAAVREVLAVIPNLPAADVPDGADEKDNKPIDKRAFGKPPVIANAKQHFELGEAVGQMDFERAAQVSGARFGYLKGDLARLERGLGAFMLDVHTKEFGYTEVSPPVMVRDEAMFGTGQLPKFKDDLFATRAAERVAKFDERIFQDDFFITRMNADMKEFFEFFSSKHQYVEHLKRMLAAATSRRDASQKKSTELRDLGPSVSKEFWLIPTAEVSLTNYVNDEIVGEAELPMRMTAFTPCFRAEAGAAGKDTRGMIRMHQFSKVELVSITTPEQSSAEHERMTDAAQEILKRLDLAHRVVTLCTGDMGFSAQKTYDIEVWLPGQNAYREISSCSNCGPFQALRMNTRWRGQDGKVKDPVHTLNGSGLAVGRTVVAILENYQNPDGSVAIPSVLQPYMGGKTVIAKV